MKPEKIRPTWVEIDLDAISHNIRQVQARLSKKTEIMAIVKADAYGHGVLEVVNRAQAEGVNWLGVATVEEGIKLRQAGVKLPILILGTVLGEQLPQIVEHDLIPPVYTYETARKISQLAEQKDKKEIKVHIKIDTGMGRIGIRPPAAVEMIKKIAALPQVNISGIFTHFAVADEDENYTRNQLTQYRQLLAQLEEEGIKIPLKHAANSAAIINYPEAYYDLVRMGLILYGCYPAPSLKEKIDLQPALSWKAKIVNVKQVPPGTSISYGCTYTTARKRKIATLPVGYHDGYPRGLSNKAEVLVKGKRCPIVGRVCMDQFMIDITGVAVDRGDVVTLIGREGNDEISAMELADKQGTINYEIISRVGKRVPRLYYKEDQLVEIKDETLEEIRKFC
jgi:alanine racemase